MRRAVVFLTVITILLLTPGACAKTDITGIWTGKYSGDFIYNGESIRADDDNVNLVLGIRGNLELEVYAGSTCKTFAGKYSATDSAIFVSKDAISVSFSYSLSGSGVGRVLYMSVDDMSLGGNSVRNFSARLSFYAPDPHGIIAGDVNDDGKVDLSDALWILQNHAGSRTLPDYALLAADANKDGLVNVRDAILVMQYYVGTVPNL